MAVPFSVGIRWEGDLVTLSLTGRLRPAGVPDVRATIRGCLAEFPVAVLVEVSGLTVDSDLPLAAFPSAVRSAAGWPPVPLLLYGATGPLAERLATHRFVAAFPDRPRALRTLGARTWPVVRVDLAFAPGSLDVARHLVAAACADSPVARHSAEAELVVSELVSNALRHADPPLRLVVAVRGAGVHVVVRDASATPPRRRTGTACFGPRGLRLVEAFTTQWGSTPVPGGKTVWAIVPTRPAARVAPER
jgi:histidine kinase-like protein